MLRDEIRVVVKRMNINMNSIIQIWHGLSIEMFGHYRIFRELFFSEKYSKKWIHQVA